MDDDSHTRQLQFEDGELVGRAVDSNTASPAPIEPGERTGFTVEVKPGALEGNSRLRDVVDGTGDHLEFGSRDHADAYAQQLSAADGSLKVQAVPENEPNAIDAYLLADHTRSITEPREVTDDNWTFDVGANLYGALGEAVVLAPPTPHPLVYFVKQDLGLETSNLSEELTVDVERGHVVSVDTGSDSVRWVPDCVVEARDGWDGDVLERYYCEIKTGDASFERSQVTAMETLAADERVLKIRVRIENLPDQYSLSIREISARK